MIRKLRFFIQRGRNGYSREDLWSFDTYLAGVIAAGCRELAEVSHGSPIALLPPDPNHPLGIDDSEEASAQAMEEWRAILDTIAFGLEEYTEERANTNDAVVGQSLALLVRWWGALWD
jgi:hypothetical protein